jgi:uncharacterized membrane protein
MTNFTWALAAFVLLHVGVAATGLRAAIVGRIGERPYRGLFSLASAGALIWLIVAFGEMRRDPYDPLNSLLWAPPDWSRYTGQALVLLGFLLGVTGLFTPGPTLAGFEGALAREAPAKGVLRITRHPFLWGVALWAAGHLFANGERYSAMLFGALGLMALFGTRSIDRKRAATDPEGWSKFAAITSNAPFAAIAQKRNRLVLSEMSWRPFVALAAFAAVAYAHQWLVGVAAVP